MTTDEQFLQTGDVVVHPKRPEWGDGKVESTTVITHQGQRAQRVVVSFARHGRVTLNTAVATLTPKELVQPMNRSTLGKDAQGGWLSQLENQQEGSELWSLPNAMTDPFASSSQRLAATLETFRFDNDPRGLIDWAAIQTGLEDPLTRYSRHDLELAYQRYARDRFLHLKDMVKAYRQRGELSFPKQLAQQMKPSPARTALEKAVNA